MPLDALCLSGLVHELSQAAAGAKIDKIYQPGRDEVVLALRSPTQGNVRLLLSANPTHPRPQLTRLSRENPDTPPMFCMLLRKHLSGARLLAVEQPPLERVVTFTLEALNELGDRVERRLVLEAIGRRSNLILLDESGRILDCMRRVESSLGTGNANQRSLLPGMFYRLPPAQEKLDPAAQSREELERLLSAAPEEAQADKWLLDTFSGLSPLVCRELVYRACGSTDVLAAALDEAQRCRLCAAWDELLRRIREGEYAPTMLVQQGKPMDYSCFPITQYEGAAEAVPFGSMAELLDAFYESRERAERTRQLGHDLRQTATAARDRVRRKIAVQEKEYQTTQDRDALRRAGDLITANLYRMEKGASVLEAEDYYQENTPVVQIALDPLLTPQQNAAKYYKRYNKAKTAEKVLREQIQKGKVELDYLESILEELREAEGEQDFREIRAELKDGGYLKQHKGEKKQIKRISKPRLFCSSAGLRISEGRNNRQNDLRTCKEAAPGDIWFHTQKIHGSHVILHTAGQQADEQSMLEAAQLAAYYSRAREGQNVPVDYTPVRYVKKPAGAKPGMVIYTTYRTVYVTPEESLVKTLRKA